MMTKVPNIILVLIVVFLVSCEDRYWPELDENYQNLLVVDGMITSADPPYTVKLSSSSSVNNPHIYPLSGYQVKILDNHGNIEYLTETKNGEYMTAPNGIHGIIGRKYKIVLTSPEGNQYESAFEEMQMSTEIESVYTELKYTGDGNSVFDITGLQFKINTKLAQGDTNYYLWRLISTYKYKADFKIRYIFDGTLRPFTNYDSLRTCWKTDTIWEVFTYNTEDLSEPIITDFPLHFVTTKTKELSIRYSLLVKQYSLSKEAYNFWNTVKEQSSELGGLYSQQPFQIRGNLKSINKPDESVLGYFIVAGLAQKRIFVDKPQVLMQYPICEIGDWERENFGSIFLFPEDSWPVYATYDLNYSPALPNQECMNCEASGGVIQKPEFWID